MDWDTLGTTFVTIAVLMDPVGIAPIFVAMTARLDPAERQRAAIRAVFAAGALIIGFALVGGVVLDYLNVSVHSLSIAGGLLLLLVALEMLRGEDYPEDSGVDDVALVPLATPLLAGPGAIATVIVLSRQHDKLSGRVAVIGGIVCALAVVGIVMLAAERVSRIIPTGIVNFLTRVFGLAAQRVRRAAHRQRHTRRPSRSA